MRYLLWNRMPSGVMLISLSCLYKQLFLIIPSQQNNTRRRFWKFAVFFQNDGIVFLFYFFFLSQMSLKTLIIILENWPNIWSINNSTIYCKNISVIKSTMQWHSKMIVPNQSSSLETDLMKGDNWCSESLITTIQTAVVYYCTHSCITDCALFFFFFYHALDKCDTMLK